MIILILRLVILIGLFFLSLPSLRPLLIKFKKLILPISAAAIFALLFYYAREQFFYWYANDFTRGLVPPFSPTGMEYFLQFILARLWAEFIVSFIVALVFLGLAKRLNRRYGERFFYEEELYLGAAAIFLVGYPALAYYLIIFFICFLSWQLFYQTKGLNQRVSTYYLWVPLAVVLAAAAYFLSDSSSLLGALRV